MKIPQFIEKAIEGGWKPKSVVIVQRFRNEHYHPQSKHAFYTREFEGIFLDPEAWKAVANVESWRSKGSANETAKAFAADMMNALFNGETIESFLATL